MVSVGVLARFDVVPGSQDRMAEFFAEGLPLVQVQPDTTVWFAFRVDDSTYGAFAAFADDGDRQALLAAGGPQLSEKYRDLFAGRPTFDEVDIVEARMADSG